MNRAQRFVCSVAFGPLRCRACHLPGQSSAGDDWLPITPEDLALKDNPANHGANAMILYRSSDVNEKYINTDGAYIDKYLRIKIFTQEGTDQGNVEIPFFKDSQDIKDLRARTIKPGRHNRELRGKTIRENHRKAQRPEISRQNFHAPRCSAGLHHRVQIQSPAQA